MTEKKRGARPGAPPNKDTLTVPNNPVAVKSRAYHTRFTGRARVEFSDPAKAEAYLVVPDRNDTDRLLCGESLDEVAETIALALIIRDDAVAGLVQTCNIADLEPFCRQDHYDEHGFLEFTYMSESPLYGTITIKVLQDIEPVRTEDVQQFYRLGASV